MKPDRPARVVLEDGTVLPARAFGADGEALGELVFNTSLCGYQEILTDPSYRGQVVLMTNPHVGNYGIAAEDDESDRPWVEGFIVREASPCASNYRAVETLDAYLVRHRIVAVADVDTRFLTRKVRTGGALKVLLTTDTETPDARLVARVQAHPGLEQRDLVREVTCAEAFDWTEGFAKDFAPSLPRPDGTRRIPIVAIDCGVKRNILRALVELGFAVKVVPASTPAERILACEPRGVFVSNGPGDPAALPYLVQTVRILAVDHGLPTFGICLGHQILAQALGARTFKMRFGHHGGNHPVKDLDSGAIHITAQNHSFAVDEESLPAELRVTHRNLNDGTIEGIAHRSLPAWSLQFHPEAAPGPHDAIGLFAPFRRRLEAVV